MGRTSGRAGGGGRYEGEGDAAVPAPAAGILSADHAGRWLSTRQKHGRRQDVDTDLEPSWAATESNRALISCYKTGT